MKRWMATMAAAGLVAAAACGGTGEESEIDGGADTQPGAGVTADTTGIGGMGGTMGGDTAGMGGDTAVPPAPGL